METLIRRVIATGILVVIFGSATACTTFCIRNGQDLLVGKNFDFYTGIGQVVVNKRGMVKSSLELPPEKILTWTSKYGSVTFNQMGVEFQVAQYPQSVKCSK